MFQAKRKRTRYGFGNLFLSYLCPSQIGETFIPSNFNTIRRAKKYDKM